MHDLSPVLLELGPLEIRYYGLVYVIGALLVYWALWKASKSSRLDLSVEEVSDLLLWMIVGVVLGARIFFFAFYRPDLFSMTEFLAVWRGGLSFHGGLAGIVLATYLYCRSKGVRLLKVADITAVPLMLALALGRIANFINGELWGTVSSADWCVVFPRADAQCRHPYQLYEGAKRFVILGYLAWIDRNEWNTGFVFWNLVLLEGLGRFVLDFWKAEAAYLGLTSGQWLSAVMIVVALYYFWKNHKEDWKRFWRQ